MGMVVNDRAASTNVAAAFSLPDHRYIVELKVWVGTYDREIQCTGLCDEHSIERVFVVPGELMSLMYVFETYRKQAHAEVGIDIQYDAINVVGT